MVSPYRAFFLTGFLLLAAGTLGLHFGLGWHWLWAYLVAVNVATIVLYGYDKQSSRSKWLRVPEKVLHGFAFLGGSPGAIAAQQLFRHKTQKRSFRVWFWVVLVLQVVLIAGVLWVRSRTHP